MRKTRLTKKQSKRSRKSIKKRATTRKKGGNFYKKYILNRDEVFEIYPGLKKVDIHFTDNDAENITIKIVNSLKDKNNDKNNNTNNIITKKTKFTKFMKEQVERVCQEQKCDKDNWVKCDGKCYQQSLSEVKNEINSTLYMLNVLGNSMINGNCKLEFSRKLDDLTNNWENDCQYFQPREGNAKSRLIMAFGPSASGKTFWVKNVIKILNHQKINNVFPDNFLSIDGGIHRESSYVYDVIKSSIRQNNASGFENLVSTGIFPGIFDSGVIKKNIKNWLKTHNDKKFNIYVPETLSGCFFDCKGVYQDYINYTGDTEYIALNIWQHEQGCKCNYKTPYKCKGTTASGKAREQIEGKKYSSSAYATSFNHGQQEIIKTDGIYMDIHNPGQSGHTAIIKLYNKSDLTEFHTELIMKELESFNAVILTPDTTGNINEHKYKIEKFKDNCSKDD